VTKGTGKDKKDAVVSAPLLLSKALSLYTTATFMLKDEVLSEQISTLAVQISTLDQVVKQIITIRFPALIKANDLVSAHSIASVKLSHAELAAAEAKLKREVAALFANLPIVIDSTTYDVVYSPVGLCEAVAPGKAPTLVRLKDMFTPVGELPVDGPENLFAAALATRLDSSWFAKAPT
jgi:hypothetical protein